MVKCKYSDRHKAEISQNNTKRHNLHPLHQGIRLCLLLFKYIKLRAASLLSLLSLSSILIMSSFPECYFNISIGYIYAKVKREIPRPADFSCSQCHSGTDCPLPIPPEQSVTRLCGAKPYQNKISEVSEHIFIRISNAQMKRDSRDYGKTIICQFPVVWYNKHK